MPVSATLIPPSEVTRPASRRRRSQRWATLHASPTPDPAPSSSTCWGRHSARATGSPGVSNLARRDTLPTIQHQQHRRLRAPPLCACQPAPADIAAAHHAGYHLLRLVDVARPPLTGAACRIAPTEASPQLQQPNAPSLTPPSASDAAARRRHRQKPSSSRRAEPSARPLSRALLPPSPAAASRTRRQPPWVSA